MFVATPSIVPVRGCKDEINDVRLSSIGGSSSSGSRSSSVGSGGGGGGEVRLLLWCSFPVLTRPRFWLTTRFQT